MKSWKDVSSSDKYKSLSPEDQNAAREQYFNDVVAPKVPPEELSAAKAQFDKDTGPKPSMWDTAASAAKNALMATPMGLPAQVGLDGAELAVRATADLPMGVTQKIAEQVPNTDLDVTGYGKKALAGVANMMGSNITPEDIDTTGGAIATNIANVAGKTDQMQNEQGIKGAIIRGGTQAMQVPVPNWVQKGKFISQVAKATATNASAGAAAGYFQPQAALDPEVREQNRMAGALTGGIAGGALTAVPMVGLGAYRMARDYMTKTGARDTLARDVQDMLGPKLNSITNELSSRNVEIDAMNANLPLDQQYKPTTNAILDAPELDPFNQLANSKGKKRLAELNSRSEANMQAATNQLDSKFNPNANMEGFKEQARKLVDNPVDEINDAMQIVANKGLSADEARSEAGKHLRTIFKAQDDANEAFYSKIGSKNIQPDDVIGSLDNAIAEDAGVKSVIKRNPNLKDVYEAKPKPQKRLNAYGVEEEFTGPATPLNVQKLRKANAELSGEINNAWNAGNYELAYQLKNVKSDIKGFLENSPDPDISSAAQEASAFYKQFQDTLRREDGTMGVSKQLSKDLKTPDKVVNDSEILNRYFDKSKNATPETAEDYARLLDHAEKNLGIGNEGTDVTRQVLYTNLKQFMRNNPTPSKIDNWMVDQEVTLRKNPQLRQEFETLRDAILDRAPQTALANKVANPEGAFSERSSFKSWMDNPETMDTAIAIAKGDKSGRSTKELRDQFGQWVKDNVTAEGKLGSTARLREVMNPETTQGKAVKALLDKKDYEHYQNVAKITQELERDLTLKPGARAGVEDPKNPVLKVGEAIAAFGGGTPTSLATRIVDFLRATPKYVAVADEFTKDPKFAEDLLKFIQSGNHRKHENVVKRLEAITGQKVPLTVTGAATPRATEGEKNEPPKLPPGAADRDTPPKVMAPQSYKLPEKYKDNPMAAEVAKDVEVYANKHNVPVDVALMLFDSESSMGTNAKKNPKSSAEGVGQLTDAALQDAEKLLGRKLDKKNKIDNIEGSVRYTRHVMDQYKKAYSKEPSSWEVKAMYQLGANGFKNLKDHGAQKIPAWQLMEQSARNHKELFFAGNKALTPRQVLIKLEKKYANAHKEFQIASKE